MSALNPGYDDENGPTRKVTTAARPSGVGMAREPVRVRAQPRLMAGIPPGINSALNPLWLASSDAQRQHGIPYLSLHYHLVFGTKTVNLHCSAVAFTPAIWAARYPVWRVPARVGGVADHVHLLVGLKATHCSRLPARVKEGSVDLLVHEEIGLQKFAWQEGYAAITVTHGTAGGQSYIANQQNITA